MDLNNELQRQQRMITYTRTAIIVMNNEVNRLGRERADVQPILAAINFFTNWLEEMNQDYQELLNQVRRRRVK